MIPWKENEDEKKKREIKGETNGDANSTRSSPIILESISMKKPTNEGDKEQQQQQKKKKKKKKKTLQVSFKIAQTKRTIVKKIRWLSIGHNPHSIRADCFQGEK